MASCWRMGCDSGLHGGRGRGAVLLSENEQLWRLGCGRPSHPLQPPILAPGLEQLLGQLTSCTYHLCPNPSQRCRECFFATDVHRHTCPGGGGEARGRVYDLPSFCTP